MHILYCDFTNETTHLFRVHHHNIVGASHIGRLGDITGNMGVDVYDVVTNGTRVSESTEKIEIKGIELEVQQIKVETDEAGNKVTATAWYSDEVPGRMVKSLTEVKDVVPVKTEMVVIDYKTIKE